MKYLFSTLFFVSAACNVFTMEKTAPEIEQLIEKKAVELSTAHKEKLLELEKRLAAYDVKIKEFEQQVQNKNTVPAAPPLIASTKLPTPPSPEKPSQTFFQKHVNKDVKSGSKKFTPFSKHISKIPS